MARRRAERDFRANARETAPVGSRAIAKSWTQFRVFHNYLHVARRKELSKAEATLRLKKHRLKSLFRQRQRENFRG
jgi:hypothetical protein